jgi:hypothetical protein
MRPRNNTVPSQETSKYGVCRLLGDGAAQNDGETIRTSVSTPLKY